MQLSSAVSWEIQFIVVRLLVLPLSAVLYSAVWGLKFAFLKNMLCVFVMLRNVILADVHPWMCMRKRQTGAARI